MFGQNPQIGLEGNVAGKPFDPANPPEPSEAEKQQAKKWLGRLKDAEGDAEKAFKRIAENRLYAAGHQHDDGSGKLVRANFTYVEVKLGERRVYARNPEVSVTPYEQVDQGVEEKLLVFSKTAEILINRQLDDAGMKTRGRQLVRAAKTSMIGWVKAIYQEDIDEDPQASTRINDSQDNVQRLELLMRDVEQPSPQRFHIPQEIEAKKAEISQQIKALESESEVRVHKGWVVDFVNTTDILLPFHSLYNFEDYRWSPWIAHRVWMSPDGFRAKFKIEAKPETLTTKDVTTGGKSAEMKDERKTIAVWECWDREAQTIYTISPGINRLLRDPEPPKYLTDRFYPFFALQLDSLDSSFWGTSTVELLKELQDEFNETRTKFSETRAKIVPFNLYRKGAYTDAELKRMQNPDVNELIGLEGTPGQPISNDFAQGPNVTVDPKLGDTSFISQDWEQLTQSGDSQGGFIRKTKTLGEAQIVDRSVKENTSADNDTIEDLISEIAQYFLEVDLQAMSPDEVKAVVGEGAQWPQFTKEAIIKRVRVNVRSGSSGKPNQAKDQENWIRFSPLMTELIMRIRELNGTGDSELSNALIKILEEGLKRFDERVDINEFLPKQGKDGDDQQEQVKAQQEQEQLKQQMEAQALAMQEMQAKIEKLQSETEMNMARASKTIVEAQNEQLTGAT